MPDPVGSNTEEGWHLYPWSQPPSSVPLPTHALHQPHWLSHRPLTSQARSHPDLCLPFSSVWNALAQPSMWLTPHCLQGFAETSPCIEVFRGHLEKNFHLSPPPPTSCLSSLLSFLSLTFIANTISVLLIYVICCCFPCPEECPAHSCGAVTFVE